MSGCRCEDPTCRGCRPVATPFAGPPAAWDGGHCAAHGAYPVAGCRGCPQHLTYPPLRPAEPIRLSVAA